MTTTTKPDTRQAKWIHVTLPRCPACGSTRLRANHTERRASGAVVRHSRCRDCGQKVYIVLE